MAILTAMKHEIVSRPNLAGRQIFYPSEAAIQRFERDFGGYISICGTEIAKDPVDLFKTLLGRMEAHAGKNTGKLYVIDNVMILNNAPGSRKFTEQKEIFQRMKEFAKKFRCHVLMIAHPKKGEGFQTTSGIADQENLVDTILRYVRVDPDATLNAEFVPGHEREKISACVVNEKVRDKGTSLDMFLEYQPEIGAVREVTMFPPAEKYAQAGYWVRFAHRYRDYDVAGNAPYKD